MFLFLFFFMVFFSFCFFVITLHTCACVHNNIVVFFRDNKLPFIGWKYPSYGLFFTSRNKSWYVIASMDCTLWTGTFGKVSTHTYTWEYTKGITFEVGFSVYMRNFCFYGVKVKEMKKKLHIATKILWFDIGQSNALYICSIHNRCRNWMTYKI